MSKYRDAVIAVILIGIAGLLAYETMNISAQYFQRASGMVYYPLLISVSIAVASLLLLIKNLVGSEGASGTGGEKDPGGGKETELDKESDPEGDSASRTFAARVLPIFLGIMILVVYVLVLPILGFIISTVVMLVALLLAYGVRNWKMISALSVGTTAIVYLSFYYLLAIQLP